MAELSYRDAVAQCVEALGAPGQMLVGWAVPWERQRDRQDRFRALSLRRVPAGPLFYLLEPRLEQRPAEIDPGPQRAEQAADHYRACRLTPRSF